jgi:hypothetical protein
MLKAPREWRSEAYDLRMAVVFALLLSTTLTALAAMPIRPGLTIVDTAGQIGWFWGMSHLVAAALLASWVGVFEKGELWRALLHIAAAGVVLILIFLLYRPFATVLLTVRGWLG